jgi:hypothetical protein
MRRPKEIGAYWWRVVKEAGALGLGWAVAGRVRALTAGSVVVVITGLAYLGVAATELGQHLNAATLGLIAVAITCGLFVAVSLVVVPPTIDAAARQDRASAIAAAEAASARVRAHASFIELARTLGGLWDCGRALWAG